MDMRRPWQMATLSRASAWYDGSSAAMGKEI